MAKIPTGPEASEHHLRSGVDPFGDTGWGGVNTEDDPVALRVNELQRGQNVRPQSKHLRSRPGLIQKVDLSTVAGFPAGAVMWLAEAPIAGTPLNLWMSCVGLYDNDPPLGASILLIESTSSPEVKPYAKLVSSYDRQVPIASYGTRIICGDGSLLRELVKVVVFPDGDESRSPTLSAIPLASVGSGYTIRCLYEFDGKLFVGCENIGAPGSSKIMVWDGSDLKDDITAIRPPQAFGPWRDKLVCGFDATAGNIQVRDPGAAPGTWTAYAAASFACSRFGNAIQEYKGYTYIASGNADIFRFNGTALSLQNTITGCATNGYGCTALCLHNGILFYAWNATTTYNATIGRHDLDSSATAYLDSYKPITSEVPDFILAGALASYRGQIYCAGRNQWVVATHHSDILDSLEVIRNTGPQYGTLTQSATAQLLRL